MKGRGEHPVDVSLEILAVASQRLDLAGLEYTSPDERLEVRVHPADPVWRTTLTIWRPE